ncbi:MAG: lipopolysaccharide biosynthesis protein [Betaproteobacteria bacterium]
MLTSLRLNTAANIAGHVWTAVLGLVFVPVYLHLLGVEAYGLIGLFMVVQSAISLLDPGAVAAINRELAQADETGRPAAQVRCLVRTLEWVYLPIAVAIAALSWWLAEPVARIWLTPERLTADEVAQALFLMGLATAAQWPTFLYWAALTGRQQLPLLNGLNAVFATLKTVGVVPVLWIAGASIENFLWWHVLVAAVQSTVFCIVVWRVLPRSDAPARFSRAELRRLSGFASGVSLATLLSFVLGNADRVVLAKLLTLDDFGYYAIATTLAHAVYRISSPIAGAAFPRLAQFAAGADPSGQRRLYGNVSQVLIVVVASVVALLTTFAEPTLLAWTGNAALAQAAAPILALLAIAHGLAGATTLPYHLQLAHGRVRTWLLLIAAVTAAYLPLLVVLARWRGAEGGATAALVANAVLFMAASSLIHGRLLRTDVGGWWWRDFVLPVTAAAGAALALRTLSPPLPAGATGLAALAGIGIVTLVAAVAFVPHPRALLLAALATLRRRLVRRQ